MRAKFEITMMIVITIILHVITVFFPVCTQTKTGIMKANFNCDIQMLVQRCFQVTILRFNDAFTERNPVGTLGNSNHRFQNIVAILNLCSRVKTLKEYT